MSFIQFESGTEKERARQELRDARAELLKRAEQQFKHREEEKIQKQLRGDDEWMLPSVSKKIDEMSTEKHKKSKQKKSKEDKYAKKKSKKSKIRKSKVRKRSSSDTSSSSASFSNKKKSKKRNYSSDSSQDEWVEKLDTSVKITENESVNKPLVREDWMSGILIPTYSKSDEPKKQDEKRNIDSYDPTTSSRELNPNWKNGGTGLPTFLKPDSDDENNFHRRRIETTHKPRGHVSGNWKKKDESTKSDTMKKDKSKSPYRQRPRTRSRSKDRQHSKYRDGERSIHRRRSRSREKSKEKRRPRSQEKRYKQRLRSTSAEDPKSYNSESITSAQDSLSSAERSDFLTDQQMNELGAKLIKAEIMGNDELAQTLKDKLEKARLFRKSYKAEQLSKITATPSSLDQSNRKDAQKEEVLLTSTNSKGVSRPVQKYAKESDLWGGRKGRKTKKVETHADGERLRFFADDDKYDLKQMFENEKFSTGNDQDEQFARIMAKHTNPNDDLEDIFAEKAQQGKSDRQLDDNERNRAIKQHQDIIRTLESCDKCFDSTKMEKQLIVSMGTNVYLSLPWHEPLQTGHCLIIPMQHVSCSTNLDEDVWNEIFQYQQALCRMFRARSQDVIFFETARYLHKRPHMVIHCIPNRDFELAPFYFKKAIQESEQEWSTNKQLISLREKNLRRSIPKGLPYFWVHFGMDTGFAHVIEDQNHFPNNFAQETIGGLLNLDARLWRRPRKEPNPIPKVKQFADWWKPFDISNQ